MRQVETYLIQRHYDGFLRKGVYEAVSNAPVGAREESSKRACCSGCGWPSRCLPSLVAVSIFVNQR